ncbi:hypothetical protein [Flavobacterium sp.]|uniref:hypothetical protein n=1 Tax=Flavobacterium sp. TaxID=239 RepID=UPI00263508C2|nr:hypothetical protein [Flavobacterium sp.]
MKTLKSVFTTSLLLGSITFATAQFGGNGMNNGMGMGTRNQQSIQNTNNFGRYEKSPEEIEKERTENIEKSVEALKTELKLDELQIIVIRKEIETSTKKIFAVVKNEELSQEDKAKEIEAISEKTDTTINTFLNAEQKEKYKKFIENRKEKLDKLKDKRLR